MLEELLHLTQDLRMWCFERNLHIHAQHLPSDLNRMADRKSRSIWDRSNLKLDVNVFRRIDENFDPLEVNLFALRLTQQCCCYFSWWPNPFTKAKDAFLQDWSSLRGFTNPP